MLKIFSVNNPVHNPYFDIVERKENGYFDLVKNKGDFFLGKQVLRFMN